MAPCRSAELMRLPAADTSAELAQLPAWASSVVVENALTTPVYLEWRTDATAGVGRKPGPTTRYDFVAPGSSLRVHPVPTEHGYEALVAQVLYGGAPPSGDAGLYCIVTAMESQQTPNTAPLA